LLAALTSIPGVQIMPRPVPLGTGFNGYFIVLNGPLVLPSLLQVIQTLMPLVIAAGLWRRSDRASAELAT